MIETVPSGTILYNHYRVERVLGSGGFGHVYLAINLNNQQPCAIKEYLVTGSTAQEQLKHEATVLSHLNHPNLPAFLDAFIENGRYYVVLNYIEGHDLTDLLRITRQRNEVLPTFQILHWLLSICDAVSFLHNQRPSVIHRDIKPDNIRITSNGAAVLVDLGNAKASADGSRTLFFIRHQGTPGYAPPEQYPGGSGTDARSDIYALGGTLYFAITGTEPPSVSVRNQALQQRLPDLPTLEEKLAQNPPELDPSQVEQFRLGVTKPTKPRPRHSRHVAQLATLPPEILHRITMIIQRAMAMRPRDRYQSLNDFAQDLRGIIHLLTPPTPPQPPQTPHPNPHSTQPDLPMIYQALQEAKERAEQMAPHEIPNTPPSPAQFSPVSQPDFASKNCPRCDLPLVSQAQFCPRCGLSLIADAKLSPQSIAQAQAVLPVTKPSAEVSPDATMIVSHQQLMQQVQKRPLSTQISSKHQFVQAPSVQTIAPPNSIPHTPSQIQPAADFRPYDEQTPSRPPLPGRPPQQQDPWQQSKQQRIAPADKKPSTMPIWILGTLIGALVIVGIITTVMIFR